MGNLRIDRRYGLCKFTLGILFVNVIAFVLFLTLSSVLKVFPEFNLLLHSKCNYAFRASRWNGKILNFRLWHSYSSRKYLSKYLTFLRANFNLNYQLKNRNFPLIVVITHHKTGTYISRKIFSTICLHLKMCCVFHVTKDTLDTILDTISLEPNIHIISHSQWIWIPSDVFKENGDNLLLIHFHRDPFNKIFSSLRYHLSGSEMWTTKPLVNSAFLNYQNFNISIKEYCNAIPLCKNCCLLESSENSRYFSDNYDFIFENFHKKLIEKISLQNLLKSSADNEKISLEASLNYFEIVRMIRILNDTKFSSNILNINFDDFMNDYDATINAVIVFLRKNTKLEIPSIAYDSIISDVKTFNIESSSNFHSRIYNLIMSKHIDNFQYLNHNRSFLINATNYNIREYYRDLFIQNKGIQKVSLSEFFYYGQCFSCIFLVV